MLRIKCNPVSCCSAIAIWTIIQTGLHLYAIIYIMWLTDCAVDPNTNNMLYLTYFFTKRCENETKEALEMNRNFVVNLINESITTDIDQNEMLMSLILSYMILDGVWIITSVALLTAALFYIQELWALLFYLPWIITAIIILCFDVFCSIFFGLRIPSEGSLFDWLHFIGINVNASDVKRLEGDMTSIVNGAASFIMTMVAARGVIVWIVNLVAIVFVIKIVFKVAKKKPTPPPRNRNSKRVGSYTAEERIRRWYQFYGTMENRERDDRPSVAIEQEEEEEEAGSVESSNRSSGDYAPRTRGVMSPESLRKIEELNLGELRGQMPWSYFDGMRRSDGKPDVVPERVCVKLTGIDEAVSKF